MNSSKRFDAKYHKIIIIPMDLVYEINDDDDDDDDKYGGSKISSVMFILFR